MNCNCPFGAKSTGSFQPCPVCMVNGWCFCLFQRLSQLYVKPEAAYKEPTVLCPSLYITDQFCWSQKPCNFSTTSAAGSPHAPPPPGMDPLRCPVLISIFKTASTGPTWLQSSPAVPPKLHLLVSAAVTLPEQDPIKLSVTDVTSLWWEQSMYFQEGISAKWFWKHNCLGSLWSWVNGWHLSDCFFTGVTGIK